MREPAAAYGSGWICGNPQDYNREFCVDLAQLSAFLHATQPDTVKAFDLADANPKAYES